jgi:ribonuclease-3
VTAHLYRTYPDLPEGHLAQVRAAVVNAGVLAEAASELRLGEAVRLGKGEDASGGREKPSILSDAMEAVIGAVYLDGGWDDASTLVMDMLGGRMTEAAAGPGGHDFKTRLQELAAREYDELPNYRVASEGPDHAKRFTASVSIGGQGFGVGEGRSKKQAEQAAARIAWRRLSGTPPETAGDPTADPTGQPEGEPTADPTGQPEGEPISGGLGMAAVDTVAPAPPDNAPAGPEDVDVDA